MRRFGCRTRVPAGTLLLTGPKLRGVRPRAVSKPPVRLESSARGKASVASERPPEGGHAASRQLHYPNPHPASLPQPTPTFTTPSNIQPHYPKPHPAALPQATARSKLRGVRPRAVSSPPIQLKPAARGRASVASERPPEGGHAASRQLQYPKQHPASLPQATSSGVTQATAPSCSLDPNCAGSEPAQFQPRRPNSSRRRWVKPPWRLNGPQRESIISTSWG